MEEEVIIPELSDKQTIEYLTAQRNVAQAVASRQQAQAREQAILEEFVNMHNRIVSSFNLGDEYGFNRETLKFFRK